jgi:hypothetical protein
MDRQSNIKPDQTVGPSVSQCLSRLLYFFSSSFVLSHRNGKNGSFLQLSTNLTMKISQSPLQFLLLLILACHTIMIQSILSTRTRGYYSLSPALTRISWGRAHHLSPSSSSSWSSAIFMSTQQQPQHAGETRTLAPGSHVSEMEIKKSRFLGHAKHVETWEEAQAYINEVKLEHPKARHWCYGFQCGVNPVSERCSDDGEPTGTAGSPILGTCCVLFEFETQPVVC